MLRVIVTLSILFSIVTMSGCQLALEKTSSDENTDEICGIFVTIGQGNSIDKKIEGTVAKDGTANFGGLDGYYMGLVEYYDEHNESVKGMSAKGLHDNNFSVFVDGSMNTMLADGKVDPSINIEEQTCEATLYLTSNKRGVSRMNPVYHRKDGSYYIGLSETPGFMFEGNGPGNKLTQTLNKTYTTTEDGKTHTSKINLILHIEAFDEAKQIFIKQMNQNDELIRTTQYFRDDPDIFIVDSAAKYVIVEEDTINAEKGETVNRYIYDLDKVIDDSEKGHTCHFADEKGVISDKKLQFSYQ